MAHGMGHGSLDGKGEEHCAAVEDEVDPSRCPMSNEQRDAEIRWDPVRDELPYIQILNRVLPADIPYSRLVPPTRRPDSLHAFIAKSAGIDICLRTRRSQSALTPSKGG